VTRPKSQQGGQNGRKTKQQEVEDWLQSLDLSPEVVAAIRAAAPRVQVVPSGAPGNAVEMAVLARADLWNYYKTAQGVAKVQTFKEIERLARAEEADEVGEAERDPLIADVVMGVVSLSPIRKRQILSVERVRLEAELAAVDGALASMDEAVVV
jgi:hypothetical protein